MAYPTALKELFRQIGGLYEAEGRDGGDRAASAVNEAMNRLPALPEREEHEHLEACRLLLRSSPHPVAAATLSALPAIDWRFSGLGDRIRSSISQHMMTSELIGPEGMVPNETVRIGLFFQSAGLDYVTRTHAAEETFIMLAGEGYWSCNGSPPVRRTTGEVIFHPSFAPHASETRSQPLFAAWRWTGEIGFQHYTLKG